MSDCVIGRERGFRCLPVIPGTAWCAKHHPQMGAERRRVAREAALSRVPAPPPVDNEIERWLETLDYDSEKGCRRALKELSQLVGRQKIQPGRAREIRMAAQAALQSLYRATPATEPEPGGVTVTDYREPNGAIAKTNGHSAGEDAQC